MLNYAYFNFELIALINTSAFTTTSTRYRGNLTWGQKALQFLRTHTERQIEKQRESGREGREREGKRVTLTLMSCF